MKLLVNLPAIDILNADNTTTGSVAKQVADAKTALESTISGVSTRVTTLEEEMDTTQADIKTNSDNISALATATASWGSF